MCIISIKISTAAIMTSVLRVKMCSILFVNIMYTYLKINLIFNRTET